MPMFGAGYNSLCACVYVCFLWIYFLCLLKIVSARERKNYSTNNRKQRSELLANENKRRKTEAQKIWLRSCLLTFYCVSCMYAVRMVLTEKTHWNWRFRKEKMLSFVLTLTWQVGVTKDRMLRRPREKAHDRVKTGKDWR